MNRFKELRLKAGYKSQKDLAEILFVNQTAVSQWERGVTTPSPQILLKLSDLYGVSIDFLLGRSNYPDAPPSTGGVWIPVLGRVAAGVPIEAIEDIEDYEEITMDMAKGGEHFALKIKGDSMEPRMKSGDVVIVRCQADCDSGIHRRGDRQWPGSDRQKNKKKPRRADADSNESCL